MTAATTTYDFEVVYSDHVLGAAELRDWGSRGYYLAHVVDDHGCKAYVFTRPRVNVSICSWSPPPWPVFPDYAAVDEVDEYERTPGWVC